MGPAATQTTMEGPPMLVALRWYGNRNIPFIVGPFNSFEDGRTWGEPRGFKICQVWAPRECENYDAMMPGVGTDDD